MHTLYIRTFFSFLVMALCTSAFAQCPIDSLGQNPSTAFPVCGTSSFIQKSVNLCGGREIRNPKCLGTNLLEDINPYWYKFTCYESGTLGFTIIPNSDESDYDWQVFDITNRRAEDVFVNSAEWSISSNWSQHFGNTGTIPNAGNLFECYGNVPKYSRMPEIIKGHDYLLLVSHFSNTQAGYKLEFGGGTASITDTTVAHLKALDAFCDGRSLRVKLNKRIRCASVALDGSDFFLASSPVNIIAAEAVGCNPGFDTDSIVLTLSGPLPIGSYDLISKKGRDGNTLLDFCGTPLPEDEQLNVRIIPLVPSPMDQMQPVLCKPDVLRLVFNKPMLCTTIAANGSDFSVAGPSPVTVVRATGANCANGTSNIIELHLAEPIKVAGQYTITLHTGSDGNTVLNECQKETPAGSTLSFMGFDTVSARIDYTINSSCIDDTIHVSNPGGNGITNWKWLIDNGAIRTRQLENKVFSSGERTITLTVSNGVCTDSSAVVVDFNKNRIKAMFESPKYVCPFDTAHFTDTSKGPVTGWSWNFGNGQISNLQIPPYQFFPNLTTLQEYKVRLIVSDENGCSDTASQTVIVPGNCYIAVPTAFTPDGDGLNDYLYPLSAYKATNLSFKVYNRYGKLVWETNDWTRKWDGRINGNLQASGTYVWYLSYTDDKNVPIKLQGTTTLIR
jgi:gliding motility-associated-like protein